MEMRYLTLLLSFVVGWMVMPVLADVAPEPTPQAVTCFKSGERTDGMYKICYYDCLGSTVAITVKSHQLCPLSIKQ